MSTGYDRSILPVRASLITITTSTRGPTPFAQARPARLTRERDTSTLLRLTGTEPQDAIGRSDHSVPLPTATVARYPPVNESRSGSRRAANARNRAYAILHKSGARSPQGRINRAIAHQSSPIVVLAEQACHAGGRGFESRRSRRNSLQRRQFCCRVRERDRALGQQTIKA
jgi:hypothetical protein